MTQGRLTLDCSILSDSAIEQAIEWFGGAGAGMVQDLTVTGGHGAGFAAACKAVLHVSQVGFSACEFDARAALTLADALGAHTAEVQSLDCSFCTFEGEALPIIAHALGASGLRTLHLAALDAGLSHAVAQQLPPRLSDLAISSDPRNAMNRSILRDLLAMLRQRTGLRCLELRGVAFPARDAASLDELADAIVAHGALEHLRMDGCFARDAHEEVEAFNAKVAARFAPDRFTGLRHQPSVSAAALMSWLTAPLEEEPAA